MEKNEVEAYLIGKGMCASDLTGKAKEAFEMYQAAKEIFEEDPSDNSMKVQFVQASKTALVIIDAMLADKKQAVSARKKVAEKKVSERKKSLEQVKLSKQEIEKLKASCQLLKEEKRRQLKSGEIKAPVKKTRVTKVKDYLRRILKLMPSKDPKDIEASEQALRKCARELFKINGLNRIESVEKELKELAAEQSPKADKKEQKAA